MSTALEDFDGRSAHLGTSVETPLERALAEELRQALSELEAARLIQTNVDWEVMKTTDVTKVGDIELDVEGRAMTLHVEEAELWQRVEEKQFGSPQTFWISSGAKLEFWVRLTRATLAQETRDDRIT